jgi:hypothetical protein
VGHFLKESGFAYSPFTGDEDIQGNIAFARFPQQVRGARQLWNTTDKWKSAPVFLNFQCPVSSS